MTRSDMRDLIERSKNDNEIIVGSEVRALAAIIDRQDKRIEMLESVIPELIEVYEALLSEHAPAMEAEGIVSYPDIEDIIKRARLFLNFK